MASSEERETWSLDQLTKSAFFHQKLHEWQLLEVAHQIEQVKGETLTWNQAELGISQTAWHKVIHRGIKPILVFAHPQVLLDVPRAVGYYRMLAMVSLRSGEKNSSASFLSEPCSARHHVGGFVFQERPHGSRPRTLPRGSDHLRRSAHPPERH